MFPAEDGTNSTLILITAKTTGQMFLPVNMISAELNPENCFVPIIKKVLNRLEMILTGHQFQ